MMTRWSLTRAVGSLNFKVPFSGAGDGGTQPQAGPGPDSCDPEVPRRRAGEVFTGGEPRVTYRVLLTALTCAEPPGHGPGARGGERASVRAADRSHPLRLQKRDPGVGEDLRTGQQRVD